MSTTNIRLLAILSVLLIMLSFYKLATVKTIYSHRAAYHWRTSFSRNNYNKEGFVYRFIQDHRLEKVYVKMLDVDWNKASGAFPASRTSFNYYMHGDTDDVEYIPVVYITNQTIANIVDSEVIYLAEKILKHTLRIEPELEHHVKEIQVDCDWTERTRERYFALLKAMKSLLPQYTFSATIRLYQYRYPERAGIPPVSKGMLMLYNVTNARKLKTENSIFDFKEVDKYIRKAPPYPIALDVALPAFSWTTVFRNGTFLRVLNNVPLTQQDYDDDLFNSHCRKRADGLFEVVRNFDYRGEIYLRKGDLIKIEQCGGKELSEAASFCSKLPLTDNSTIAIFDLDENDLKNISYENIEKAYTIYR